MRTRLLALALFAFMLLPVTASAAVSITEIMYDAPGTDTKHEWIEVQNTGAGLNMSSWRLDDGANHNPFEIFAGSETLSTGAYAIIASDPSTFLADYPSYSGAVFKATFSLTNTGKTLTLKDGDGSAQDSVFYNVALGAAGDGNTLQKIGSSWQAKPATPGTSAAADSGEAEEAPPQTAQNSSSASSTESFGSSVVTPQIRAFAGDDRTVVAGAETAYQGQAVGLKGETLENARYVWTMGNGDTREGRSFLYAFAYPGTYAVSLDVSSGGFSASDRITVTAVPANLAITEVTDAYVKIENRDSREVDVGLWGLSSSGRMFTFPPRTIILAKSAVSVSNAVTGLSPSGPSDIVLLYPNGSYAAGYQTALISPAVSGAAPARAAARSVLSEPEEPAPESETPENAPEAAQTAALGFLSPSLLPWALALILVVLIAGFSVYLVKGRGFGQSGTGYRITEIGPE